MSEGEGKGNNSLNLKTVDKSFFKNNEVQIENHYSSLNYKDALSAKGHTGITRQYPHIPGVDSAGKVISDSSGTYKQAQEVIVTGQDLGMNTYGGFSEFVSVPSEWIVPLPIGLSLKESMMLGTGGITAAICINEIINSGINPDDGKILVTGSTGAVGSTTVAILAKLGYDVICSTGKKESHGFLRSIGASEIISREDVYDESGKPLLKRRWKAAIDTVGGNTLSTIIRSTDHHGVICVVGLVESPELQLNVFPFLQRGVRIIGIDSAERGIELKRRLWRLLATDWKPNCLSKLAREVGLSDLKPEIDTILAGKQVGKVLINIKK
ncbi:MAG: oxidoreductase [Candidatus Kapaibacteriales bacterium]